MVVRPVDGIGRWKALLPSSREMKASTKRVMVQMEDWRQPESTREAQLVGLGTDWKGDGAKE